MVLDIALEQAIDYYDAVVFADISRVDNVSRDEQQTRKLLRVYAQAIGGSIYHYRDKNGLECDAVVHLRNGRYGFIEIKLGGENLINEGAKTLAKLSANLDTSRMETPSFCMILTAVGNYAYKRDDGIWVVPVTCLKV